jgi:hypothetical protein
VQAVPSLGTLTHLPPLAFEATLTFLLPLNIAQSAGAPLWKIYAKTIDIQQIPSQSKSPQARERVVREELTLARIATPTMTHRGDVVGE